MYEADESTMKEGGHGQKWKTRQTSNSPSLHTQNTTRGHHPRVTGERLAFKQIKIVLLFGVGGWSVSGWSGEGALSCPLDRLTTTREAGEVADTGDVV